MTADYTRGSSTEQVAASSGQSLSAASRLSNYTNRAQMARRAERDAAAAVVPGIGCYRHITSQEIPGDKIGCSTLETIIPSLDFVFIISCIPWELGNESLFSLDRLRVD
jgi:hypothetical protein